MTYDVDTSVRCSRPNGGSVKNPIDSAQVERIPRYSRGNVYTSILVVYILLQLSTHLTASILQKNRPSAKILLN